MNAFNLSVRAKLYVTLTLATLVMITVGVVGLTGARTSNLDLDAIFSNRFMPTGWVGTIESHERELLSRAESRQQLFQILPKDEYGGALGRNGL